MTLPPEHPSVIAWKAMKMDKLEDLSKEEFIELIRKKDAQLRFAAGYISATPQFSDKHPEDVLEWIGALGESK